MKELFIASLKKPARYLGGFDKRLLPLLPYTDTDTVFHVDDSHYPPRKNIELYRISFIGSIDVRTLGFYTRMRLVDKKVSPETFKSWMAFLFSKTHKPPILQEYFYYDPRKEEVYVQAYTPFATYKINTFFSELTGFFTLTEFIKDQILSALSEVLS